MSKMQLTLQAGTDFWNDSCDLSELEDAVNQGAVGATSNPVIVRTVVKNSPEIWARKLEELIAANPNDTEDDVAWKLIAEVARSAACLLRPVFDETGGEKGRLAIQVNPKYYRNADLMIAQARELAEIAPNLTIKLPATPAGLRAMEMVTAEGITVTATVCYSVSQAVACAEAMERGINRGGKLRPFIAIMVGRSDDHLKRVMAAQDVITDPGYLEWAGIAVFKKAYRIFMERGYAATLLCAAYRNHMQWSQFIGGEVVLSMPYKWWNRFNASDVEVRERMGEPVEQRIVTELYDKFRDFRRAYDEDGMSPEEFAGYGASVQTLNQFINAYVELVAIVSERMLC